MAIRNIRVRDYGSGAEAGTTQCVERMSALRNLICLCRQGRTGKARLLQNNTTGKSPRSAKTCPALSRKIFLFSPDANHRRIAGIPSQQEGRLATSRNAGRDAVDAFVSRDVRHRCVR